MKKIIKSVAIAFLSLFLMTACDPQEGSDYALGTMPTAEQLNFTITPKSTQPNIVTFENTSSVPGIAVWSLGDGSTAKGETVQSSYPLKGEYDVTLTLYTSGGSVSKTQKITIANDDMALLDTPFYNALTGGAANTNGKVWVFDQYHEGHMGVGPFDSATPSWWVAPVDAKVESSLYSNEFTFTQVGTKLEWVNNGSIYTGAAGVTALAAMGYTESSVPPAGDFDVKYAPQATYKFVLNEAAKTITLSDGAFFGHYAGTSTYEIISLTDEEMYVKCVSIIEPANGWWYRLIPKEKNVKPNIVIPMKTIPLNDDFESATPKVAFSFDAMGTSANLYATNPAPVGINTSKHVMLYEKSTEFWSNTYFQAVGYKFDLTEQNKITCKVFIPSYNDFTTNYAKADWLQNTKLLTQVSVKLQNGQLGGNAWSTQTEIAKVDLAKDKWIDLTFDFSTVATRQDYDRIVIQFGAEGHAGPGIFFLDDFKFTK